VTERIIAVGVHIADALAWPVHRIPPGQQLEFVQQIKFSPAGTSAATSMVLAKLGHDITSVGRVGDDSMGRFVTSALAGYGVNTDHIIVTDQAQTSASLLPIREDGSRPALHVIGANALLTEDDIPWDVVAECSVFHMAGTFILAGLDGAPMARVLARVKSLGLIVTMDFLMPKRDDAQEVIGPSLPYVDYIMPNIEEAGWLVGTEDRAEIIRWFHNRGVGTTLLTMGGDGVSVAPNGEAETVLPAYEVEVIDSTGCGDAFSAGFISGLVDGLDVYEAAARALACGSLVASGLGADSGIIDKAQVLDFAANHPRRMTAI
jgi:sugar/nucleoside kinase (ribokinase family)